MAQDPIHIAGVQIKPGEALTLELSAPALYTHDPMPVPVQVIHGKRGGPRLFVSAAIHGDEINGVEIIRRLMKQPALKKMRGTLIAIPIVNVHGFVHHTRYLPDRRDLNRSFPGSIRGSLSARLANLFIKEIVEKCTHGIDLHTAAVHRENLPQIRANLDDEETARLASAFNVPVLLNSNLRDGSLRQVAADMGIPMLLYEAGEALRFDELSIRAGVKGVLSVMRELQMLPYSRPRKRRVEPTQAHSSVWVRAPRSGILRMVTVLGERVRKNAVLGVVADPFGENEVEIHSIASGIIIGRINMPLVYEGDALFHIARFESAKEAQAVVDEFRSEDGGEETLFGEPPIV